MVLSRLAFLWVIRSDSSFLYDHSRSFKILIHFLFGFHIIIHRLYFRTGEQVVEV